MAAKQAAESMARIPAESLAERRRRYMRILDHHGTKQLYLYESGARHGRLLGEETFSVERWYRAAGLSVLGAELPDHASVELSFLGYLAEMDGAEFRRIEREFIHQHASHWLPRLGHRLATSGDSVYGPIGRLLYGWLTEVMHPIPKTRSTSGVGTHPSRLILFMPAIERPEDCILCGFCVQVCPTNALAIFENKTMTRLALDTRACTGCRKCERICETGAIAMKKAEDITNPLDGWITLRQSERVECAGCGTPMVSQAEMDYLAARLENPFWLNYCADCRQAILG